MGSAARRAREKENLRRTILDAARDLFTTENYEAISMRKIADRIEYSPTAIYLYFKDKDEILYSLVEEGFQMLTARLEAIPEDDPAERLRQGGREYVAFALSQPHYYKLMFQLEDRRLVEECKARSESGIGAFSFILRTVAEGQAAGQFRTDIAGEILSHAIWAQVHGAVSLVLSHRLLKLPAEAHPAFFEAVSDMLLRGLKLEHCPIPRP